MKISIILLNFSLILFSCKSHQKTEHYKNIISKTYYYNGSIKEIQCKIDSIDSNSNTYFTSVFYEYHENGKIKSISYQGKYKEIGTSVGTWIEFDSVGKLIKKTTFHNDIIGKDFILYEYYINGKIHKIEKFNNFILYETEKKEINY